MNQFFFKKSCPTLVVVDELEVVDEVELLDRVELVRLQISPHGKDVFEPNVITVLRQRYRVKTDIIYCVGGFNPFEKIFVKMGSFPYHRGEFLKNI